MNIQNPIRRPPFYFSQSLLAFQLQPQSDAVSEIASEPESVTLWTRFQTGGCAMYPLLAFSVAVVGLAVYCGLLIREKRFTQP